MQGYIAICLLWFWYLVFQNSFHSYFFGQIWFQNLEFSELTEIWYRGTLLYVYYNFNIYFFKILFIHIFLGAFGAYIWNSSNLLRFHKGVHCYMLITILSKFLLFIFFWANLVPKSEVLQINRNLNCYILMILMFIFSKFFSFIFCFGHTWSQNLEFSKLTEIWWRDTLLYAYYNFCFIFQDFVIFLEQIWSQNLMFSKFTEIWCWGTLPYAYYDFVYFFESFVIHIILGKFGPKIWCPNWLEPSTWVHY